MQNLFYCNNFFCRNLSQDILNIEEFRTCSKKIFLSSAHAITSDFCINNDISDIFVIAEEICIEYEFFKNNKINFYKYNAIDNNANSLNFLEILYHFINIYNKSKNICIVCHMGISRSATMLILMFDSLLKYNYTTKIMDMNNNVVYSSHYNARLKFKETKYVYLLDFIRKTRPCVNPSGAFKSLLLNGIGLYDYNLINNVILYKNTTSI